MTWPIQTAPPRLSTVAVSFKNFSGNVQSWKTAPGISFGHDGCTSSSADANQEPNTLAYRLRARVRRFGRAGRLRWSIEVDERNDGSAARCARVFNDPVAAARSRPSQPDGGRPAGQ